MNRTAQVIVLCIFFIGLFTVFYLIWKFFGYIGVGVGSFLAIFGLSKTAKQTATIPSEQINKNKEFVNTAKKKQEEIDKKADDLEKEMEAFLEELKRGIKQ